MANIHRAPLLFLLPLALMLSAAPVLAHDNGMDMSMDGAMALDGGAGMRAYLHFTLGDNLWFFGWVPQSAGAAVGACIGLFLLALVDRWLAAIRATAERAWMASASAEEKARLAQDTGGHQRQRTVAPFVLARDLTRGVLHAMQAALGFTFMLAVMTFNAAFIIAIVLGLGVGEAIFGRYTTGIAGSGGHGHGH